MNDDAVIQRNAPCPCGSGRKFKHCCGDIRRGAAGEPAQPPPAQESGGTQFKTKRTFVVVGCPRGGTSVLAGALHHAGVHMGAFTTTQYEDPDFKIPPDLASGASARLAPVIRSRNEQFEYWGWKVPNSVYYIQSVAPLLVNPCFLFIYRDPLEIARSSARHDEGNWDERRQMLFEVAVAHTALVRRFQKSLRAGHHEFWLEAIHRDAAGFVDRFIALLAPLPADRDALLRFVSPDGGYH